jgi:hypothetical protein
MKLRGREEHRWAPQEAEVSPIEPVKTPLSEAGREMKVKVNIALLFAT